MLKSMKINSTLHIKPPQKKKKSLEFAVAKYAQLEILNIP